MSYKFFKINLHILFIMLTVLLFPQNSLARNAIGFLEDPDHSIINAGQPFSYMESAWDWGLDESSTCVDDCDHPLGIAADGHEYAIPNLEKNISIETWRTATHLHLVFSLDDHTNRQLGGETLEIGDIIIIQIDPNNSGGSELEVGSGINQDYRFKIVIKDNSIDEISRFEPIELPAPNPNIWSLSSTASEFTAFDCTPGDDNPYDCLKVQIPLEEIGNPSEDIGISIGTINDLGHGHLGSGGLTVWDITGTVFPSSMGLEVGSDPGLIDAGQASGNWLVPGEWGTGYFSVVPLDVTFSHSPSYTYSDSFRLSRCNLTSWNSVGGLTSATDQFDIVNWYQYNPDDPCKMKIWLKAFKSGLGIARGRLFVVWGRPGISPQDWYPVHLTSVISFSDPEEIISFVWENVPPVDFTSHPCLRVYLLPEALTAPYDETRLRLTDPSNPDTIDTAGELSQLETLYGVYTNDPRSAQINFYALSTGSCDIESCSQVSSVKSDDRSGPILLAQALESESGSFLEVASIDPITDKKICYLKVDAKGFAVATEDENRRYSYITPVGGVNWLIPCDIIDSQKELKLPLAVSNPLITTRNFVQDPPQNIQAPAREIFLLVRSKSNSEEFKPKLEIHQPYGLLQPGESTATSISIIPSTMSPWSLSLRGGFNTPHSRLSNVVDTGGSFNLGLEYLFKPNLSAEVIMGYHGFGDDGLGSDLDIYQFSLNGRYYPFQRRITPFINAGAGYYLVDPGDDGIGFNIGTGFDYDLNPPWSVEGAYNYHKINSGNIDPEFSVFQIGLKYRF